MEIMPASAPVLSNDVAASAAFTSVANACRSDGGVGDWLAVGVIDLENVSNGATPIKGLVEVLLEIVEEALGWTVDDASRVGELDVVCVVDIAWVAVGDGVLVGDAEEEVLGKIEGGLVADVEHDWLDDALEECAALGDVETLDEPLEDALEESVMLDDALAEGVVLGDVEALVETLDVVECVFVGELESVADALGEGDSVSVGVCVPAGDIVSDPVAALVGVCVPDDDVVCDTVNTLVGVFVPVGDFVSDTVASLVGVEETVGIAEPVGATLPVRLGVRVVATDLDGVGDGVDEAGP
jgi:hypothetical protein